MAAGKQQLKKLFFCKKISGIQEEKNKPKNVRTWKIPNCNIF